MDTFNPDQIIECLDNKLLVGQTARSIFIGNAPYEIMPRRQIFFLIKNLEHRFCL